MDMVPASRRKSGPCISYSGGDCLRHPVEHLQAVYVIPAGGQRSYARRPPGSNSHLGRKNKLGVLIIKPDPQKHLHHRVVQVDD